MGSALDTSHEAAFQKTIVAYLKHLLCSSSKHKALYFKNQLFEIHEFNTTTSKSGANGTMKCRLVQSDVSCFCYSLLVGPHGGSNLPHTGDKALVKNV